MRTLLVLIILVLLGGGGYYWYTQMTPEAMPSVNNDPFGARDANQTPPANTDTNTATNSGINVGVDGSVSVGATKEFTITNSGMTFTTKTLAVKKGDRVRITFKNTGGTHDFRVDGYNAGTKVLSGGQQETFEFVADKAGSFEYYCSVGNHRQLGMKGTLTVTQ